MPHPVRLTSVLRRLCALALLGAIALSRAAIPAFPGAEGYGAYAIGGRGGDVYHVTNLNSSGAGSFADAIATVPTAGRTIVFDVSGYIRFPSGSGGTRLTSSKVTIAGQTAPGDGVGFYNNFFRISGDDIVIRHLRFRHGKYGSGGDCIDLDSGSLNAILDHISMQFSTDENMSSYGSPPENLTLQYSINAWGLESHSCGGLWDQNHASSHHNLWAHNHTRNPKARPNGLLEWVNNVTFDWDIGFIMGDSYTPSSWKTNVLNNYFICPPGNLRTYTMEKGWLDSNSPRKPTFSIYVSGNLMDKDGDGLLNGIDYGYAVVQGSEFDTNEVVPAYGTSNDIPRYYKNITAFTGSTAGIVLDSPLLAYKKVVSNAGALRLDAGSSGALRDEVDSILFGKLTTQTHFHVTRESDTGASASGFGVLNSTSAPIDTDRDGMPDYWETALGFSTTADDHNTAFASSGGLITAATFFPASTPAGYTYLEEYLHFLAIPHGTVARNTLATPSSFTVDLRKFTAGFTNTPVFTLSNLVGGTAAQSGTGGYLVVFTPTVNTQGRARFEFNVTDADGSSWTQTFALLVTSTALPRDIVWKGDSVTNAWDELTGNWLRNGSATTYSSGDRVTFDDTGSRSPAVAIATAQSPGSVDVNTATSYTLSGAGAVTSSGPLSKRGAGTLTINTTGTNSFSSVTLEEGTITLGNTTANNSGLGTGTLTINSGTLNMFDLGAGGSTTGTLPNPLVINGNVTLNAGARCGTSGALSGAGTLTLYVPYVRTDWGGNPSAFSGTLNVITDADGGEFRINNSGTGAVTNYGNARVWLADKVNAYFLPNPPSSGTLTQTVQIGELATTGTGSGVILGGANGASNRIVLWEVGALNTSTTFGGAITNRTGPAALTKVGTGTLTLTGASTATGATLVNAGTLIVSGSLGTSPVTVASGAVLAGGGALGGTVTANAGAILSPATAPFTGGTLTAGGLSLNGNTLYFDLSNSPAGANDKIALTGGALTMAGTQYFQLLLLQGTLGAGTYDLISGAGSISASGFTLTHNLPSGGRQTFTLAPVGTTVRLTVAGDPATLTWTGTTSANWDATVGNFSGATPNTFGSNDAVVFDDTGTVTSILIPSPVTPRSTLVNNTTKAFTFAGGINGGSLTKAGTNTLTLNGTNTYSGGTFLNGGTIILADDNANSNALGSGPVTFANGTTLTMYNNVAGDNTAAWGMVVPTGVTATLNADSRVTLSGALTGAGTLNLRVPYIRTNITGDWSAFTGTINVTTDGDGGEFRFGTNYSYAGFPSAAIVLPDRITALYLGIVDASGTTISFGELSGTSLSSLKGGATAGRPLTYRIGGKNTSATFAGAITEQTPGSTSTSLVKTGSGSWTLTGAATHAGSTTVEQGTLVLAGSINNTAALTVASGATLSLVNGTVTVDTVNIQNGANLTGAGTINNELVNDGTVTVANGGTLTVTGDVTNNGTLRLTAGSKIVNNGTFVNGGLLDLMTAGTASPGNFVNNGTFIDASAARLKSHQVSGTAFTLKIDGYSGHTYKLQTSIDLTTWTDIETRTGVTGQELAFTHDAGPSARRFYRIVVQ